MITGKLNKKITIQKEVASADTVIQAKPTYTDYCTVWANVYVRSVAASFGDSETLIYNTEFTIRYNSLTKEINNKYKIIYNNQEYRINEVIETEERHSIKLIAKHWYGE